MWTTGIALAIEGQVTILRIRGDLLVYLNTAVSIDDGYAGAVGIGIVIAQAFATGVGAVPDAVADSDWDGWMYHRFFNLRSTVGNINVNDVGHIERFQIDSKAMRKWSEGNVLFGITSVVETGDSTLSMSADSRVLLALS